MDVVTSELPWELLYADDLVLMATTTNELRKKLGSGERASYCLLVKGLKVKAWKTKLMVGGDVAAELGEWPCGVCHNSGQLTRFSVHGPPGTFVYGQQNKQIAIQSTLFTRYEI